MMNVLVLAWWGLPEALKIKQGHMVFHRIRRSEHVVYVSFVMLPLVSVWHKLSHTGYVLNSSLRRHTADYGEDGNLLKRVRKFFDRRSWIDVILGVPSPEIPQIKPITSLPGLMWMHPYNRGRLRYMHIHIVMLSQYLESLGLKTQPFAVCSTGKCSIKP